MSRPIRLSALVAAVMALGVALTITSVNARASGDPYGNSAGATVGSAFSGVPSRG